MRDVPIKANIKTDDNEKYVCNMTLMEDINTKKNIQIFVIKIAELLTLIQFKDLMKKFATIGGRFSKYNSGFVFKENPLDKLESLFEYETI